MSIGKTLAGKIISTKIFTETLPETSFQLKELNESTVLQQLLSPKANKAIGLDKISARLLKCPAHSICPSITKLLNMSIRSSTFSEMWKCSKVSALYEYLNLNNVLSNIQFGLRRKLSTVSALFNFTDENLHNMEKASFVEQYFWICVRLSTQ